MSESLVIVPQSRIDATLAYIDENPRMAHMRPLFLAVKDASVRLGFITPGRDESAFLRDDDTTIYLIGDDLHRSEGPMAFHKGTLRKAARASVGVVIVAGYPEPAVYAAAAAVAAGGRVLMQGDKQVNGSVIIVETQPYQERAWQDFLTRANPSLAVLMCTTTEGGPAC